MFRVSSALLASALSSILTGTAAAASPPEPITIPIRYEDARVYIKARANEGAEGWFILDTGATPTLIDATFGAPLKLTLSAPETSRGAGAGTSTMHHATPVSLRIGAIRLDVKSPVVTDLAKLLGPTSGLNPAGVIGSQFFLEHTVEIDFQRREMRVWPRGADRRAAYTHEVALAFAEDTPLTAATLSLPNGQSIEAKVLVDLGAKSTLLVPEPFIARERLNELLPGGAKLPLGAGVGGNTYYRFVRIKGLALNDNPDLSVSAPVIGLSVGGTLKSQGHSGLLGAEYLDRFKIAFDYSRALLLLTPVGVSVGAPIDRSGLFLAWKGDGPRSGYFVRDVLAGGPGDTAGVRPDDEIVAVNGRRANAMPLSEVRDILKSKAETVQLQLLRAGRPISATVWLRDLA